MTLVLSWKKTCRVPSERVTDVKDVSFSIALAFDGVELTVLEACVEAVVVLMRKHEHLVYKLHSTRSLTLNQSLPSM